MNIISLAILLISRKDDKGINSDEEQLKDVWHQLGIKSSYKMDR